MSNHEKILLFKYPLTVRWQDMDAFNHVNHANYFIYLQECRVEWLKSHNIFMDPSSRGPIIREISCKYLRPITYPAQILVELYFSHRSGRKIIFTQEIRDGNNPDLLYANAVVEVVWINFITGRSIPEPEEYRHIVAPL